MSKVAVVGLGYVGLPLALLAAKKDHNVVGIDLDKKKIKSIKKGVDPIGEEFIANHLPNTTMRVSTTAGSVKDCDIVLICVPTPVKEDFQPDLSAVKGATNSVVKSMRKGTLVIIESTINPGVCDEIVIPLIEQESGWKVNKDFYVAHCPERINPGDPKWHIGNINRVLGASSPEALKRAYDFYSNLIDAEIKKMDTIKEAEAVKVVENSFRDVNIAFVNELAMSFNKLGINIKNVINGAANKPFGFMAFNPGIGVGGHCIPVDPYYLIEYAKGYGFDHHFLQLARNINENMPIYTADSIEQLFLTVGKGDLHNKKIIVLGLSYKADVGDSRESPSYKLISSLKKRGADVTAYDPYVSADSKNYSSLEEAIDKKDAVVIATAHSDFRRPPNFFKGIGVFFDGPNAFAEHAEEFKALDIAYAGIGT